MSMYSSRSVRIEDPSGVGEARRAAQQLGEQLALTETEIAHAALAATELGTNIVKYSGRGELVLRPLQNRYTGIEILALDRGPGIENIGVCLQDGYSTSGSPGTGLGAVRRIAQTFDIYSTPARGTAVLLQIHASGPAAAQADAPPAFGLINLCKPGETHCGDAWAVERRNGRLRAVVADGLGHGQFAAEAAWGVIASVRHHDQEQSPLRLLAAAHERIRSTRGAAAAIVDVTLASGEIRYAGIGNIGGGLFNVDRSIRDKSLASMNGTLGSAVRKLQEFAYSGATGSVLVMYSDGLASQWDLTRYPGLLTRHPALVAGVLYRDYARGNDDVTVLVLAVGKGEESVQ